MNPKFRSNPVDKFKDFPEMKFPCSQRGLENLRGLTIQFEILIRETTEDDIDEIIIKNSQKFSRKKLP